MSRSARLVCLAVTSVTGQDAGSLTAENHPSLSYQYCNHAGCQEHTGKVVIDSNWRWTHQKSSTTNCYTGNTWDAATCSDPKQCHDSCVVEGADKEYTETYGIKADGNNLRLDFVTEGPYSKNIGSRTYLMQTEDQYKMFHLKNREFTFTVDDAHVGCGLNGALYFVAMDKDGGKERHGNAGAKYGMGYCDAQCPHDLKWINNEANVLDWKPSETDANAGTGRYGSCCTEIDLWEANKHSMALTMHSCDVEEQTRCEGVKCGDNGPDRFNGLCDKNGCDLQPFRLGNTKMFGPGDEYQINTLKPVQVTTQFITEDGTDHGKLTEVRQFYTQDGKVVEHPKYTVNGKEHDSITSEFCSDWVSETKDGTNFLGKGGLDSVDKALEKGVVLVMSLWDDHYANMLWLDSTFPVGGNSPGDARGPCSADSGNPKVIEEKYPGMHVQFSNIKWGKLGTTAGQTKSGEVAV